MSDQTDALNDFDWNADDSIAVREQPAIAVYQNRHGQVVLRREQSWDEDEDCFIPIAMENVLMIVGAILRAAGMEDVQLYRQNAGGLCYDIDIPEPIRPAEIPARPLTPHERSMVAARPDIDGHAAMRDFEAANAAEEERPASPPDLFAVAPAAQKPQQQDDSVPEPQEAAA